MSTTAVSRADAFKEKASDHHSTPERRRGSTDSESRDHRADNPYSRALIRKILLEAAARDQVDPKLVLALSYWESGWDQSRVAAAGAVGLMQVLPASAQEAGPALQLHAPTLPSRERGRESPQLTRLRCFRAMGSFMVEVSCDQ